MPPLLHGQASLLEALGGQQPSDMVFVGRLADSDRARRPGGRHHVEDSVSKAVSQVPWASFVVVHELGTSDTGRDRSS